MARVALSQDTIVFSEIARDPLNRLHHSSVWQKRTWVEKAALNFKPAGTAPEF